MNIWSKKYNKTNKSVYEISKELNVPEEKIKEVIKGERQVPKNEVDRVNGAFSSNTIGISSFERAQMEQFFMDNDIQDLKKKFGYKSLEELSNATNIGVATMYYFRGNKIKAISDKLLKKAYDFFQDEWSKKVEKKAEKKVKPKRQYTKKPYYQMPISELSQDVIDWYNTTDLKALLKKEGITATELLEKLGFNKNYSAIYYKYAKGTINGCTTNYLLVQQLYNYYHGLELMNTTATTKDELYGNINTPVFEYDNEIDSLDVEPIFKAVDKQKDEDSIIALDNSEITLETAKNGLKQETYIDKIEYISIEEYNKVVEELERYKFLIDMMRRTNE